MLSEDLLNHIRKAQIEAQIKCFKSDIIFIDEELAMTNGFPFFEGTFPPTIFGLKVKYFKDLAKDWGFNFMITKQESDENELICLRKENQKLRETIEKLKKILENEIK